MAAITWAMVQDHAPELSTVDVDAQNDILNHVNNDLFVDDFGGEDSYKLKLARIYLAAHLGTMALPNTGAGAGPVTSWSLGDMAVSYGGTVAAYANATYAQTVYGQQYHAILRTTLMRLGFVV